MVNAVFFVWIAWFLLLFHVIGDIFRRRDASGGKKTLWIIFVLFVPFLGVFVYLIANSDDMARRQIEQAEAARSQMDDVRPHDRRFRRRSGRDREGQGTAGQRCNHAGASTTRSRPRPSPRRNDGSEQTVELGL